MKLRDLFSGATSLREAAAIIFALSALLPLLLLLFLLWRFDLVGEPEVQVGLSLAVLVAVLGFTVSLRMVNRISRLAQTVEIELAEQEARASEMPVVPGLGRVAEIGQLTDAFGRLLQDLRQSTARLEDLVFKLGTLNEMVELTARIPKIQDLLALVLERTMRAVRATIGSIMLLDPERGTLRIAAARGLPEEVIAGVEVRLGEGISGTVAQLGDPVLVDNIETDPRFAKANDPKYGSGSFICMPIRVGNRVLGVLNLAKKEYVAAGTAELRPFSPADFQFMNALMTHIAYAVDNARLLDEARQSAVRLQEVVEDQQLRLTLAQQERLQAEKLAAMGQLLAGVAHELNNPLSVVLGQAALLRETIGGGALAQRAEKVHKAAERCARIVRNFLALAREHPPERQEVQLNQVVEEAVELLDYPLRVDNVKVRLDLAPDLSVLWADPHQLHQVVVNLITNAHQAMRESSQPRQLTLITRCDAEWVSLEVADTGPGIPAAIRSRIFEPFFTTKPQGQGTGLGLSLCQGMIEGHGGTITVESEPGRGARFRIELPVEAPPEAVLEAPVVEAAGPMQGKAILVVDDEPEVADVLADLLAADGHEVEAATKGTVALRRLQECAYDLILSDMRMPELDGPSLYREIERRHPGLHRRVIFLTGDTLSPETREFLKQTGVPSLSKPFVLDEVRRVLRRVLQEA